MHDIPLAVKTAQAVADEHLDAAERAGKLMRLKLARRRDMQPSRPKLSGYSLRQ